MMMMNAMVITLDLVMQIKLVDIGRFIEQNLVRVKHIYTHSYYI